MVKPNRWSCLPTAFAIVENIDPVELISNLKHDGSEILFPELSEPACRRGFHPQEILDYLYTIGSYYMEIDYKPAQQYKNGEIRQYLSEEEAFSRMNNYLKKNRGVLVGFTYSGNSHALAVKEGYFYDPDTGNLCSINGFKPIAFFMKIGV